MQNYIQKGNVIDYTVPSGVTITAGQIVNIGQMSGVAANDGVEDDVIAVNLEGVFEVEKTTSLAITAGDELFVNATTKKATKTNTDKVLGIAWANAATNDTTVLVKLIAKKGDQNTTLTQAANVAALGITNNLTALAVTPVTFTGAATAGGSSPSASNVNDAIDALAAEVKTAVDAKADNADVETLRTEVEARLDAIEAKVDAEIAALKAAGLQASS